MRAWLLVGLLGTALLAEEAVQGPGGRPAPRGERPLPRQTAGEEPLPAHLLDPAHPAASVTRLLTRFAVEPPTPLAAKMLEQRARVHALPLVRCKLLLTSALYHHATGNASAAREAARHAAELAGEDHPAELAMAALIGHYTQIRGKRPSDNDPLAVADRHYEAIESFEGRRLVAALRLRDQVDRLIGPSGQAPSAAQREQLLAGISLYEADLNRSQGASALADLQVAWTCRLLADSLGSGTVAEASDLARRATRMAVMAHERARQEGTEAQLLQVAARGLAGGARLAEHRYRASAGDVPDTATLTDIGHSYQTYEAEATASLRQIDSVPLLLLGGLTLVENLSDYTDLLLTAGHTAAATQTAGRLVELTHGIMPIADRASPALPAVAALLGAQGLVQPQEIGVRACLAMHRLAGDATPTDGVHGSYLDYGFWFYEQAKSANLTRIIERLTAARDDESSRALGLLNQAADKAGVELFRLRLDGLDRNRPASPPAGRGQRPTRGPRASDPGAAGGDRGRELARQLQDLRAQSLLLELGDTAENRQMVALLTGRLDARQRRSMLPDPATAAVALAYDWAFVITAGGTWWRSLTPPGSRSEVFRLVSLIGNLEAPEAARLGAARSLYDSYYAPLADLLAATPSLLLAPDGPLANLPFEALVAGQRGRAGTIPATWREADFLGEHHAITYVPSLTLLAVGQLRARNTDRSQVTGELLAVGDVVLPGGLGASNNERFVLVPTRGGAEEAVRLAPLPHTAAEARAAVATVGGPSTLLLGPAATKDQVTAALPRHRMLHLATHGVLADDSDPLGSGLLLSAEADGSPSLLTAREVYGMRLPARLAVLSACDTASGRYGHVSGGVTSLARAFLYAGVPGVVASLWPVDDEATARLMTAFYGNATSQRRDDAAALREAKAALRGGDRADWSDPYYWAAFLMFR